MNIANFNLPPVAVPAFMLVTLTSIVLLMGRSWRWMIAALAVQYVGVFILSSFSWPLEMAIVKLVAGWMAGATLGVGMAYARGSWQVEEQLRASGRILRLLVALLIGLVIYSSAPRFQEWLPDTGMEAILGGMILFGMGLLHLGFSGHPFRVITGLLTILSGFEILYASLEVSVLVAGLLAAVNLGLALACVFIMIAPSLEPIE